MPPRLTNAKPNTLNETMKLLQVAIEDAMSELYDLERATINRYGEKISDSRDLRSNLQRYWKQISEMLKTAYIIGDDVALLRSRIKAGTKGELQALLEDLKEQITDVELLTSDLVKSYETPGMVYYEIPVTPYDKLWQPKGRKTHQYEQHDNREWYPDGHEALLGYKEADIRVFQCLKVLNSAWKDQLEFCDNCIRALDDGKDAADQMVKA
ncbi:12048_t:CDS:2, partial [Acaulospora colombiana]